MSFSGFGPEKGYQFSPSQSLNRVTVQGPSWHTPIQNLRKYPPPPPIISKHHKSDLLLISFLGTPFLALTGTTDGQTQSVIIKQLEMKQVQKLFVSPNRPNLQISVMKCQRGEMFKHLA